MLEEVLANHPQILKYFQIFGGIGDKDADRQAKMIQKLTDFHVKHSNMLTDKEKRINSRTYDISSARSQHYYFFIAYLREKMMKKEKQVLAYEQESMKELLDLADEVAQVISEDPRLLT